MHMCAYEYAHSLLIIISFGAKYNSRGGGGGAKKCIKNLIYTPESNAITTPKHKTYKT